MKQGIKYTIVFIIFITIMIVVFSLYFRRYDSVFYKNGGNALLNKLYELEEGSYKYENGNVTGNDVIIYDDNFYFDGTGEIEIDKYGNIKFFINTNGFCVYKNSLSSVKFMKSKCNEFYILDVGIIRNNNKISFKSSSSNLEYKISNNDDFNGEWIKKDYDGNLIINSYNDGNNYIWFKDTNGNISNVIKFNVDCLNTDNAKYNSDIFYCSGSVVNIDDKDWIVISDKGDEITLMMNDSLEEELPHCFEQESESCYYMDNQVYSYRWSNSYVNSYLNNTFINELGDNTKNKLVTKYICDDFDREECDGNCGGYTKEVINHNNWECKDYTSSKVRLISFDEYNYIYKKIGENKKIKGTYLMINSLNKDKASIVDLDYSVFINEDLLNVNKIRPVITLKK